MTLLLLVLIAPESFIAHCEFVLNSIQYVGWLARGLVGWMIGMGASESPPPMFILNVHI